MSNPLTARFRNKPRHGRSLTASAARQPLDRTAGAAPVRKALPFQVAAYEHYRGIPEITDGLDILANASSRVRFYPARLSDDGKPRPVTPDDDGKDLYDLAHAALAFIGKGPAQAAFIRPFALNMGIAGEVYVEGYRNPETGTETARVRSVLEVEDVDGKVGFRPDEGKQAVAANPAETLWLQRVWQPDPAYLNRPTSRLQSLASTARELLKLSQAERAGDDSRLARSGVLFVDNSVDLPPENAEDERSMPQRLADLLFDAASASITIDGAAASAVPIVAGVNTPQGQKMADLVFHQAFDRPADDSTITRRERLVQRIGRGLPVPADTGTSKAGVKFSNAMIEQQELSRLYVEPSCEVLADGLTSVLLTPYLMAAAGGDQPVISRDDAADVFVWYDSSELTTNPDRSADAEAAHASGALGDKAYLLARGFTEADGPTPGERVMRLLNQTTDPGMLGKAILALGAGWDPSREGVGGIPNMPPPAASAPPELSAPGAPAPARPPVVEGVVEKPLPPGGTLPPRPVTAALRRRSAPGKVRYAAKPIVTLDGHARERVHTETEAAVRRAVEKAGSRVKGAAQKDPNARTLTANATPQDVCRLLQPAMTAALLHLDTTSTPSAVIASAVMDKLATDTRTELRTRVKAVIDGAQRNTIRLSTQPITDPTRRAAVARRQQAAADQYSTAALNYLDEAVSTALTAQLFGPETTSQASLVPYNVARAVMAISAGLPIGHAGYDLTGNPLQPSDPVGLATGELAADGWRQAGFEGDGYEWQYGVSSHSFDPHLDLNGARFSSYTDPVLENPGSFPADAYLSPADHDGCSCDIIPLFYSDSGFDGDGDNPSVGPDRPLYLDSGDEAVA